MRPGEIFPDAFRYSYAVQLCTLWHTLRSVYYRVYKTATIWPKVRKWTKIHEFPLLRCFLIAINVSKITLYRYIRTAEHPIETAFGNRVTESQYPFELRTSISRCKLYAEPVKCQQNTSMICIIQKTLQTASSYKSGIARQSRCGTKCDWHNFCI